MPIYEYQCQSCEHEFEALQKISDPLLSECPSCNEQALRKKVSAAAFRLKGGGWYETDFKTGNKKNVAGAGDKSESKSGDGKNADSKSGDSKSSDSKVAAEKPKPAASASAN